MFKKMVFTRVIIWCLATIIFAVCAYLSTGIQTALLTLGIGLALLPFMFPKPGKHIFTPEFKKGLAQAGGKLVFGVSIILLVNALGLGMPTLALSAGI